MRTHVGPDERLVVYRFGKLRGVLEPGDHLLVPLLDRAVRVSVRPVRDDVAVPAVQALGGAWIGALLRLEYVVLQPEKVAEAFEDGASIARAVTQLVQAAFAEGVAAIAPDRLIAEADRRTLGRAVKKVANEAALGWGVDITAVEVPELRAIAEPAGPQAVHAGPAATGQPVDVVLIDPGRSLIEVIKVLRRVTGWDLTQAKAVTDQAPYAVLRRVERADAEDVRRQLEAAGATVELK